jgi:hypothetical protein
VLPAEKAASSAEKAGERGKGEVRDEQGKEKGGSAGEDSLHQVELSRGFGLERCLLPCMESQTPSTNTKILEKSAE